ncbi:hypothetical protein CLUG_01964 [Clavispora lusitaniae ATCC 42720]|uniref:Maintenance of telomere capping protein 6 n=1 Tax=Clavispora lusitaniae (strain ATCC 42720) TaxID=306902 RepID=C4Y182_CLAL4|nr:uncharacterized protein CLUG_01964 [Clavispora lusitaniae ATCC 42720]EEQ37841.1 hypothetical protein CLUG_01964 [Clavispora lusitaniae ATCC 42720]
MRGLSTLAWFAFLSLSAALDLSDSGEDGMRSQRDLSDRVPIDHLSGLGVSLNRLLFDHRGYTNDIHDTLSQMLDLQIGAILIDVFWSKQTQTWQLCPVEFPSNATDNDEIKVRGNGRQYKCQPSFTLSWLMKTVSSYLRSSDVRSNANVLQIMLRLLNAGDREEKEERDLIEHPFESTLEEREDHKNAHGQEEMNGPSEMPDDLSDDELNSANEWPDEQWTDSYEDELFKRFGSDDDMNAVFNPAATFGGKNVSSNVTDERNANASLVHELAPLGHFLFTPNDLDSYWKEGVSGNSTEYLSLFPSQMEFLYDWNKRVVAFVVEQKSDYNISEADRVSVFFPNSSHWVQTDTDPDSRVISQCQAVQRNFSVGALDSLLSASSFRSAFDDDTQPFTNDSLRAHISCGTTAVLNASNYNAPLGDTMNTFVSNSFWSWAPDEPRSEDDDRRQNQNRRGGNNGNGEDDDEWRCVVTTPEGWEVANCHEKLRLACQSGENPFNWTVSDSAHYYFESSDVNCPHGYYFGVPRSSLEQLSLVAQLHTFNDTRLWIDVNDVAVQGCFVTGGPLADCPYRRQVSGNDLALRVAPSVVVAAIIFVSILYESLGRITPIHTNRRRHWRRVLDQYYKENDYEGVPS